MRLTGLKLRALLALVLAALCLTSPAKAGWIEGRSAHFDFYGDMSPQAMRRLAERLELYDAALRRLTSAQETPRVTVYVLPNIGAVGQILGMRRGGVAGFYVGTAQGPYIVTPETSGNYSISRDEVLFHEYAHHMLLSNSDQFLPSWASEGMAELFGTVRFSSDGKLTFGAPPQGRGTGVMAMSRLMLEDLLTMDERRVVGQEEIEQRYSRGWLLSHYLMLSGGDRPRQFARYIALINSGTPTLEAARQAFGDLNAMNREFDRYRNSRRFQGFELTTEQLGGTPQVEIHEMAPGKAAIMPLRIRSVVGVDERTAPQLIAPARLVASRYPNEAFVWRALAEMEFDANNLAQADAAADRALALEPNNIMALVYKSRIAGRRASANEPGATWAAARAWAARANRADPNHPLPFALFYDSYSATGQTVPDAVNTGMARAVYLLPQDGSLRIRLALSFIRSGAIADARKVLAPVAFRPHGSRENKWRRVLDAIDANKTSTEILAVVTEAKLGRENLFLPAPKEEDEQEGN